MKRVIRDSELLIEQYSEFFVTLENEQVYKMLQNKINRFKSDIQIAQGLIEKIEEKWRDNY
ncbi:hypothetical protein C4577_06540 [Candidatus Parcubacteria bacterium]|nr:MAG: hypothetical protein C4577_06540 [Candidatus Parcubacteria bacterium]